jgi:hypothetical protein
MTTYATNISTPAAAIVTALATAVTNAQTLSINLAPSSSAFLAGTTLGNLATSATSWKGNIGDMRVAVADLQASLSVANQKAVAISALLSNIGTLD